MTKSRNLISNVSKIFTVLMFLVLLFPAVKAQCPDNCATNKTDQGADVKQGDVNPFPNELEGFRFFGEGKLGALRLGVSTREDIGKIFGAPIKVNANQETYNYDPDWLIRFGYFDSPNPSTFCSSVKQDRVEKSYTILPEYFKTIAFVQLIPKKKVPFNEKKASLDKFGGTGSYWSRKDPEKLTAESKFYQDLNGLLYVVDFKDSHSEGNFKSIEYHILPSRQCEM